ncbi:DUF4278 domain-containing protein [Gloeocapsa sp. PCC 73106]|uniref:DUF4278 domain-containing protein n=1 Tax=Gloeocapsa sp. PCC 73106 TaxID=102232 RepID=UPI0002AD011C|nr:DUF4278 domain-containing protein [Gloeocapsa sp. PCC 73106]ELR99930.1 hypothetical protein GLO73106DRAFT_00037830 [Gloeocapsa sp. PCC 73106]
MKLSYRGINYEQESSSIEFELGELGGKYRGSNWHYRYPRHMVHIKPKVYRQYRGVAYSSCPYTLVQESYCRFTPKTPPVKNRSADIHWENMRRSLDRRLAVALEKGDTKLISLLEKESQQLSL